METELLKNQKMTCPISFSSFHFPLFFSFLLVFPLLSKQFILQPFSGAEQVDTNTRESRDSPEEHHSPAGSGEGPWWGMGGRFRDSCFPTSLPTLTLSVIFIIAILVGMKCHFTVLLIWFDAQKDVEHLCICVFYWVFVYLLCTKVYSDFLLMSKVGYLSFDYWVVKILCVLWICESLFDIKSAIILSHSRGAFSISWGCPLKHQHFKFWWSQTNLVHFGYLCFKCYI